MAPLEDDDSHLTFRSFSARILVDGKPLLVYGPEYDEATKTASGWIASEPGKQYSVEWRIDENVGSDVVGKIHLDGLNSFAVGAFGYRHRDLGKWIRRDGRYASDSEVEPFVFSELEITDDPTLPTQSTQLGSIAVKMFRVWIGDIIQGVYKDGEHSVKPQVNEKTKKIGCHITQLGARKNAQAPQTVRSSTPFSPADVVPFVTFNFKPRSIETLQALGVAPLLASQETPSGGENDGEDEEQVEQAEAEIVALQAALHARMDALAVRKRVKREEVEASIAAKRRRVKQEEEIDVDRFFTRGEVIDLTDL